MRKHLLALFRVASVALSALVALPVLTGTGTAAAGAAATPTYYVNLGDSYAVGYQPGLGATPGYAGYVAGHTKMTLANFGCGGATTTSVLQAVGCPDVLPHTAGLMTYPTQTQIAAADAFISAHKGHIGLITVSISGNDVTACAGSTNAYGCVATAVQSITTNVTTLAGDLRAAAGPKVPIIGSTYPDVVLGSYVHPVVPPSAASVSVAKLSVPAFELLINPALAKAYGTVSGVLVDVTRASGSYVPLTKTVRTPAYGTIPVAVANVCRLAWYCSKGDIHAKTVGYVLIGTLIVARYHAMSGK